MRKKAPVAVLMTLHAGDRVDLFEIAFASVMSQRGVGPVRVYLCCDGPLGDAAEDWLTANCCALTMVLRNDRCMGLAYSLNRLIRYLGDEAFVFRMDGDDISDPDRFATQIAYMQANPDLGLIGCQAMDIDDLGRPLAARRFPIAHDAVAKALMRMNPVLHPSFCIRRSVLDDPRARYPLAYLTEDLAFLVRLTSLGVRIGNCPETLINWRTGAGFFRRRKSLRRGLVEALWYARAIHAQRGGLVNYAFPLLRLAMRLAPQGMIRALYRSGLRGRMAGA